MTRLCAKAVLVALALVVASLAAIVVPAAIPAGAATTVINFDEQANFAWITNQYASRGVTFTGSGAMAITDASVARTDPNFIVCGLAPGQEFCSGPASITGSFSTLQGRVKLWVGYTSTTQGSFTVTMRAFNSSNALVGSSTHTFPPPLGGQERYPVTAPLEVVATANVISRFDVITSGYFGSVAHDDLEFERYEPDLVISPNPADFGAVNLGSSRELDISLQNSGKANLGIRSITVTPGEFVRVSDDCINRSIAPGGACTARVRFTPPAVGNFVGAIDVVDNTPAGKHTGRLVGRGQQPSTTNTTAPPDTTTTSTTRPIIGSTTTTSVTATTIPTITTIPPVTPGATLTITPPLGPAGFVSSARGTGFPPNQPVGLGWSPGLGLFQAAVGPDGTFETRVLVMNRDVLGPRTLVASGGGVSATAVFLVLQSTVQPSGKNVAQINRTRRFLNR